MKKEFHLFPDISLICGETADICRENVIEISCCVSGVCEYKIGDEYFYITQENCIAVKHDSDRECVFSHSSDYCCISLLIGLNTENNDSSDLFEIPGILRNIEGHGVTVFLNGDRIKTLISDIYYYCTASDVSMIRVKVLELFVILGNYRNSTSHSLSKIESIGNLLSQNEYERITITKLSEIFNINSTTLKNEFKQYYGSTIYAYSRNRKMFLAARLMKNKRLKVIDIAEKVGYSNPSKFSSAFRAVMGVSPKKYRENVQTEHWRLSSLLSAEKQPKIAY